MNINIEHLLSCIDSEICHHISRYGDSPNMIVLSRELHTAILSSRHLSLEGRVVTIFGVPASIGDIDGFVLGKYVKYEYREEEEHEESIRWP